MDPSQTWPWLAMSPITKTYLSLGLVGLAVVEYATAMRLFGRKGPKPFVKQSMQVHRICGYLFFAYFAWISWVCLDMMERLHAAGGYTLDARGALHGALAITLLVVWLVKVSFVRLYPEFKPYVRMLGIVLAAGTVVLWGVAGWMFLWLVGAAQAVGS
jgi:hypothetical protein